MTMMTHLARGAVAGAAGTTALNAATFLDMAIRGRPASSTPEQTVERGLRMAGASVPGDEQQQNARRSGLGSLLGTVAGVGAGVVLGALRGAGRPSSTGGTVGTAWVLAMLVGNGPMTVLGVTNPATWAAKDWVADVVPHTAYALAAAGALETLNDR